jgi:hypothetical protein
VKPSPPPVNAAVTALFFLTAGQMPGNQKFKDSIIQRFKGERQEWLLGQCTKPYRVKYNAPHASRQECESRFIH